MQILGMNMFYLIDNKTGQKYEIMNISFPKLLIVRMLLPVSYVLYGLIITFFLAIAGFSSQLSLILLTIAYLVNIPLSLSKNHLSAVEQIHSFLATPLINSMVTSKEQKSKNKKFKDESIKEKEKELKAIRFKFEKLNYEKTLFYLNSETLDFEA